MTYRIPFGNLKIGDTARKYIDAALAKNWISEGDNVRLFEKQFSKKFGWKHAIATSSGTDAGIVVWSAVRELCGHSHAAARKDYQRAGAAFTPACAFVATANCLLASGLRPVFVDVSLDTLNLNILYLESAMPWWIDNGLIGINFIATMGKPTPIGQIAAIADEHDLWLIYDGCEAHGATVLGERQYADRYADAAIYSFYAAHLIVAGEGGIICTDDDELAELCRSIKSHGRPAGSNFFDFERVGFNAKANELTAAIGLEGLERFDENFAKRREVRQKLIEALSSIENKLILYRDGPGEIISPHAFPILLRDESADIKPLYEYLELRGIQCKTLWGALSNHGAFSWMNIPRGTFPIAEAIGQRGLHFSCGQFLSNEDIDYIARIIGKFFLDNA